MFLVQKIAHEITVEVLGIETTVPLSYADGMTGTLPVFDKYGDALEYAGDDKLIVEIQKTQEKTDDT